MSKINYTARWIPIGAVCALANVSFTASSDAMAKRRADKIAKDLNVTRTPRTLTSEGRVVECIATGLSNPSP